MGRTVAAPGLAVTEHELAEILTLPAFALHAREGGRGMQPKKRLPKHPADVLRGTTWAAGVLRGRSRSDGRLR